MKEINEELESVEIVIEKAKRTEEYTLLLKKEGAKQYVLSKYAPREEAIKLVDTSDTNKKTLWIIFGFGFGYILDELISIVGDDVNVFIIEPSSQVLQEQMSYLKDDKWAVNKNVTFFSGNDFDELNRLFLEKCDRENVMNIRNIIHNGYEKFYLKYCEKVVQNINSIRLNRIVNQNTIRNLGNLMVKNIIMNGRCIDKSYDIRTHKDKYKNIPAVIVGAGPSLKKNIQWIRDFKGMIFTGSRNVKEVEEEGTKPDFVCVVDPKPKIYDTFNGKAEGDFPLITICEAAEKVVACHNGPQYFVNTNGEEIIDQVYHMKADNLNVGGSVTTLCIAAAHYMGCNPIIFIGQDLAYGDNINNLKRYATATKGDEAEDDSKYIPIKGYYGNTVYTKGDFKTFLNWIEDFIQVNTDTSFINATEGGAAIGGAEQIPFKEVIRRYQDISKPVIEHTKLLTKPYSFNEDIEEIIQLIDQANKLGIHGERLSQKLFDEYKLYKGNRIGKIQKIVSKLDHEVDPKLAPLLANPILNLLFTRHNDKVEGDTSLQEQIKEDDNEQGIRVAELNMKTYHSVKQACKEAVEIIEELKQIEKNTIIGSV